MTTPGRYLSFDQVAEVYDLTRVIPPAHMEEIVRLLARETNLVSGGLFLDAGIGTGRFAAPLAKLYPAQVVGVDISTAMMGRIATKTSPSTLSLAQADLQRLPFQNGKLSGVLLVHILHLIERWPLVLSEVRRVLTPKSGVLFLGVEMGGRSVLVDFYFERARVRRVLAPSVGTASLSPALAYLRRRERDGGAGAQVTLLETPHLAWKRTVPTAQTLEALTGRTYSQMWGISETDHTELLAETLSYAHQTFRKTDAAETLPSRFSLYAVRW
ncbi:MAG: class I SAM-dependent methyltransferase [Janthinobacterium lividum]